MNSEQGGESNAAAVAEWDGVELVDQQWGNPIRARSGSDRRQRLLRTALCSLVMGRRHGERRRGVLPAVAYVDVHEPLLLFLSLGIVAMSVMDAFLTLSLLHLGAEEANPFMALLLEQGVTMFLAVKYGATAIGVVSLVMHKRYSVLRIFDGYRLLGAVFVMYVGLMCYELSLLLSV